MSKCIHGTATLPRENVDVVNGDNDAAALLARNRSRREAAGKAIVPRAERGLVFYNLTHAFACADDGYVTLRLVRQVDDLHSVRSIVVNLSRW